MTDDPSQPPAHLVERVRSICAGFVGSHEHQAWTGTSWRIGTTTFAHIVQIDRGGPRAYVRAFGTDGPATVVTFQADADESRALEAAGPPYHRPPWRPGIVGIVVDDTTEWTELAEHLRDSYRECGGGD